MLDEGILVLVEINFLLIGLLPVLFFRKGGRLTIRWWLTASPFFVAPAYLLAAHFGFGYERPAPWPSAVAAPRQ